MQNLKLGFVMIRHGILWLACMEDFACTSEEPRQDTPLLAKNAAYLSDLPIQPYDQGRPNLLMKDRYDQGALMLWAS